MIKLPAKDAAVIFKQLKRTTRNRVVELIDSALNSLPFDESGCRQRRTCRCDARFYVLLGQRCSFRHWVLLPAARKQREHSGPQGKTSLTPFPEHWLDTPALGKEESGKTGKFRHVPLFSAGLFRARGGCERTTCSISSVKNFSIPNSNGLRPRVGMA